MQQARFYTGALSLVLIIFFTSILSLSPAEASGVFRFPLFWIASTFDPVFDSSNSISYIAQQVGDGLVAYDRNLRVIPGLAKSWRVSKDGREYLFTLRDGVKFHNGKPLTADDVVASILRIFRSGKLPAQGMFFERIDGASELLEGKAETLSGLEAVSEGEVRLRLAEPYAPFLSSLATPLAKIIPANLARDTTGMYGRHPVGTGPFVFVSADEKEIILRANPDYFSGPPKLDEIRFVLYRGGDRDKAFTDFKEGRLEGAPLPGSVDPAQLRKTGFNVISRPRLSMMFYGMNVKVPPFDNPDLRMALALGTDRKTNVSKKLGGSHFPANQILPPGMPGYTPDNALLKYDPKKAARLLEKAGYPQGRGLEDLNLASASHSNFAVRELELFAADMARLGVKVSPVFVDSWDEFKKGVVEGKYPLFRYAWYADAPSPDDFMAPLFETGSSANLTHFSRHDVDSLLEKARKEIDPAKRAGLYRKAESTVLNDAPVIPLLFISTQAVFQAWVHGIDLPAIGSPYMPLRQVSVRGAP